MALGVQMTGILFVPGFGGMYPWKFAANFLILRIISYNMDYYWALKQGAQAKKEDDVLAESDAKPSSSPSSSSQQLTAEEHYALMVKQHRPLAQYNLINFISYILYAPLYVAGPILPFNAFVAQMERPQTHRSKKEVLFYAVRWFVWLALMETLTHHYPFFAVTYSGVFRTLSPRQLAVTAYMTLKLMWLKFFLMWRFFRLWAMIDGVETVENMPRCMSNNYSLQGFWRQWHSSYNQWLVRYMYVPLGGRERRSLSVWLVFLFVGLWHDAVRLCTCCVTDLARCPLVCSLLTGGQARGVGPAQFCVLCDREPSQAVCIDHCERCLRTTLSDFSKCV